MYSQEQKCCGTECPLDMQVSTDQPPVTHTPSPRTPTLGMPAHQVATPRVSTFAAQVFRMTALDASMIPSLPIEGGPMQFSFPQTLANALPDNSIGHSEAFATDA